MEWWFHPDRVHGFQRWAERRGAKDFMVAVTAEEDARVRVGSWTTPRGGEIHHRTETQLDPDGLANRQDDRFIASFTETVVSHLPMGRQLTLECIGTIAFMPTGSGACEVVSTHNHSLSGGNWLQRQRAWKTDLEIQPRQYRELAQECETDLHSEG